MSQVPRLRLNSISHRFFDTPVNVDISLEVEPGEVLGLVGENGAGKSTLMNIVGGVFSPTEGSMEVDGAPYRPGSTDEARSRGIAHVHQELNLFSQLSVVDNVFLTSYPRRMGVFTNLKKARAETEEALKLLDLPFSPTAIVEQLSPGHRQMLEIVKATFGEPGLIILDEPTTSLTSRETHRLFQLIEQLSQQGTSFIYVSHILDDIKRLSNRIAIMRDGRLVDLRPEPELPVPELITLMVGRSLDSLYPTRAGTPSAEPILTVDSVSATGLIDDASLTVHRGEVLGVFGLMGAGRTELANVIFGLEKADAGTITLEGKDITRASTKSRIASGLGFVTEDRRGEGLLMQSSVMMNAALPSLRKWTRSILAPLNNAFIKRRVADSTGKLRLKAADLTRTPVQALSGGNQQKVVLAKWLLTEPSLLILDEPTRGVDVGAQFEVYRTALELADQGTGILLISSELPELLGISDRIVVMRMGRIVAEFTREQFDARRVLGAAFGEQPVDIPHNESDSVAFQGGAS